MKLKLPFLTLLLGATCGSLFAQGFVQSYNFINTGASTATASFANTGVTSFFISWKPEATLVACSVQVDSSADGVTWGSGDLIASQSCTTKGSSGTPKSLATGKNFLRIHVTALTGNGGLNVTLKGWGGGSSGGGVTSNSPVPAICLGSPVVCFTTPANTKVDTSATFTTGLPTVTTSSGAPAFSCPGNFPCTPSTTIRAQASICNISPNPEKCTAASADTTISSFTGAHTATLASNFNSSSTGTFQNIFTWGTPDDAAIASALSAAIALTHATIYLPCSGMWIEQAAFVFPASTPGPMTVAGCSGGTSVTIGFNFNYAGCNIGCFYDNRSISDATVGTYWNGQEAVSDVRLTGIGNPSIGTPAANHAWILLNQFQQTRNVSIHGANWNTTNGFAAVMLCGGAFYGGGIQAGGDWAFRSPSGISGCNQGGIIHTPYINNGLRSAIKIEGTLATQAVTIAAGTWIFNDSASRCTASNDLNPITLTGGVLVMESGVEVSTGSAPCQQSTNSVSYIDGLYSGGGGGNSSIAIFHGKSYIKNINFSQNVGLGVFVEASDAFVYDLGGWTVTGTTIPQTLTGSIGNYYPFKSVSGACTGVATASSTLGLFGTGPNVTATTCTSTTIGSGVVMDRTGNLFTLQVTATAAGVNVSSGVVTVLKNGSATTVTCTIGTATSCADFAHLVAFSVGDLISIQFTTQAAETLAGVKAVLAAE